MRAANSAAQVSTVLNTGRMPRACRTPRTTSSRMSRILPTWASEKPCRLARRSICGVSSGEAAISAATSLISSSWSTNHGSMAVASKISSGVAPARRASITLRSRPSCGMRISSSRAALSRSTHSWDQSKTASLFSRLRSAFCSASVKLRPIAIASPTDFMWVVSVGSAEGNFSKANRGTLTTT